MSLKYHVQKVSPDHYVLPRVAGMKVEAHAFFSESLYERSEESLWSQLAAAASYEGVVGAYLMPDAHAGYGVPVGCVVVTDGTIIQAGSGYDISCGVLYLRASGLHAADVADWDKRRKFIDQVELRVATGVGSGRPKHMPRFSTRKADDILRHGAKALGVRADLCERQSIDVDDEADLHLIRRAWDKVVPQLGSVGGGNHFIEMQVDRDSGEVWVMIHCGSRGYGWQTANHFFHQGAQLRGLRTDRREDSWLHIDEPLGRQYWAHHNSAANYAVANRHIIVSGVQEALRLVFQREAEVY
ncbi:MAG: RtcB family protein, partial [Polyangiales bacterium]